jgi:hypothetical protein
MSLLTVIVLFGCFLAGANCGYLVAIAISDSASSAYLIWGFLIGGVLSVVVLNKIAIKLVFNFIKGAKIPRVRFLIVAGGVALLALLAALNLRRFEEQRRHDPSRLLPPN